jgi:hypothetical protein
MDVWLMSTNAPKSLWDILKNHFVTWTHRVKIIKFWCGLTVKLTEELDLFTKEVNGAQLAQLHSFDDKNNHWIRYRWYKVLCMMYLLY